MKKSENVGADNDILPPLDRIQSIRDELDILALQIPNITENALLDDKHKILRAVARGLLRQRNIIASHFDSNDFVDPATNLMLFIYGGDTDKANDTLSTGACCEAAGVPRTTGLRWIGILEGRGLLLSTVDPKDRRKTTVRISPNGRAIMDRCLMDIGHIPIGLSG